MILPPTSKISHHHKVTNITMLPTSLSPLFQYIPGFSKPFILNVFDEESVSDLEEPVIQWGDMVKQTKLIKQGEKVTNIAVCYQKATGSPSGLQFGFK